MGVIIDVDSERIAVIPNTKVRLNILVEHPKRRWKEIRVRANYHPEFGGGSKEFSKITEPNEAGISVLTDELTIPTRVGEHRLGDIQVNIDGETKEQYLPKLRILTLEGFFEEKVAEKLRKLGFDAIRLGGPRRPDIEAVHKKQPEQRFQVEATTEDHYDLDRLRRDKGKFHELKRERNYRRLLIVVNTEKIAGGVTKQLRIENTPVSLITFRDLSSLSGMYEEAVVSSYEIIATLSQTGIIAQVAHGATPVVDFRTEAFAEKTIRISVRFEATPPIPQEEGPIIAQVKGATVSRVIFVNGMTKISDVARFLEIFRDATNLHDKSSVLRKFSGDLRRVIRRPMSDPEFRVCQREVLRLLTSTNLIDNACFPTIEGDRFLRYFAGDREKFTDLAANLFLIQAGWIAVVRELYAIRRGMLYATSQQLLADSVTDRLSEQKLVKRTDSWSMISLIDCLTELGILRPWDAVQKTHEIDWKRVYDVIATKSFT